MPKFKVGQSVIYHRKHAEAVGLSPTVEAIVDKVSLSDGITKYKSPLYHISWPPRGYMLAQERDLSPVA